jgi:hypothetical protein
MYAVVITVRIDPTRTPEALEDLATVVVPHAKSAPGFVRGTWAGGDGSGHAMVLFDTREHAEQMAASVQPPPEAAAQVERIGTYEVHAEA